MCDNRTYFVGLKDISNEHQNQCLSNNIKAIFKNHCYISYTILIDISWHSITLIFIGWFIIFNTKVHISIFTSVCSTEIPPICTNIISMGQCKKEVTPLLTHWSYVFLTLIHRYGPFSTNRIREQFEKQLIWRYKILGSHAQNWPMANTTCFELMIYLLQ